MKTIKRIMKQCPKCEHREFEIEVVDDAIIGTSLHFHCQNTDCNTIFTNISKLVNVEIEFGYGATQEDFKRMLGW